MATENPEVRAVPVVPARKTGAEYPLIDSDPYFFRVIRYMRTSDYIEGTAAAAFGPGAIWALEKLSPSRVRPRALPPIYRLAAVIGLTGGFLIAYSKTCLRFYGATENKREVDMDMREMVDKVKKGEPLYGKTEMTEYQQGMASRNSRYSSLFSFAIPWFNLVNHNQHGVDTAKYYQQAERELEQERNGTLQ